MAAEELNKIEIALRVTDTISYTVGIGGVVCSFFVLKWLNQILSDPSIITGTDASSFYHKGVKTFTYMGAIFLTLAILIFLSALIRTVANDQAVWQEKIAFFMGGKLLLVLGLLGLGLICLAHEQALTKAMGGGNQLLSNWSTTTKMNLLIAAMVMLGLYCFAKLALNCIWSFEEGGKGKYKTRPSNWKDIVILGGSVLAGITLIVGSAIAALTGNKKYLIAGAIAVGVMIGVNIIYQYLADPCQNAVKEEPGEKEYGLQRHCYKPVYAILSGICLLISTATLITAGVMYGYHNDLSDLHTNAGIKIALATGVIAFACYFAMRLPERLDKHIDANTHDFKVIPGIDSASGCCTAAGWVIDGIKGVGGWICEVNKKFH